jgi:hypothetical protein
VKVGFLAVAVMKWFPPSSREHRFGEGCAISRHARPCAGHPRLDHNNRKTWMGGTSPAMTA